jgi:hypothetical protein
MWLIIFVLCNFVFFTPYFSLAVSLPAVVAAPKLINLGLYSVLWDFIHKLWFTVVSDVLLIYGLLDWSWTFVKIRIGRPMNYIKIVLSFFSSFLSFVAQIVRLSEIQYGARHRVMLTALDQFSKTAKIKQIFCIEKQNYIALNT